ncbi:MAG: hypothetical protein GQ535_06015 [Rhodobacteraceae bacterium]|nr:hypothetical protein [Paracoccaceae bacterium]
MDHTIFTPSPSAGGSIRRLIRSQGTRPRYVVDCRDNLSVGPLLPLDNLPHFAMARITAFGKACLAGEASQIEANGYEGQIASVHLSSKANHLWLREGDKPA